MATSLSATHAVASTVTRPTAASGEAALVLPWGVAQPPGLAGCAWQQPTMKRMSKDGAIRLAREIARLPVLLQMEKEINPGKI